MKRVWALVGCLALAVGCRDAPSAPAEATVSEDTFVDTYVDLRVAGLSRDPGNPSVGIDPADRERILAEHGVSMDDLLEFVEVHGTNVPYIAVVWDSVEVRFRRRQDEAFSAGDSTG